MSSLSLVKDSELCLIQQSFRCCCAEGILEGFGEQLGSAVQLKIWLSDKKTPLVKYIMGTCMNQQNKCTRNSYSKFGK